MNYQRQLNDMFNFGEVRATGAALGAPPLTALQAYGLGLPEQFVQQFGDPLADSGKTSVGVFAQDSWRIKPRLILDYGLRYDVETTGSMNPSNPVLEPMFHALHIQRRPPVDKNNLQPRVGFSYRAQKNANVTLRGSYGIYYDRLLNLATYLARVGDGGQMRRAILSGQPAVEVFRLPKQKLDAPPGGEPPTGLVAFSSAWGIGKTQ